jgi:uncharacterized cupin superfamily protein
MKKVNTKDVAAEPRVSPGGKFGSFEQGVSVALGREPASTDLLKRQPFDVAIRRVIAGRSVCPYHAHTIQWEFYHVLSGTGVARDQDGATPIGPGDAFVFAPHEAHQLTADPGGDLVLYIVADNPLGDACHYPDSKKWSVSIPQRALVRSEPLDYYDGEE